MPDVTCMVYEAMDGGPVEDCRYRDYAFLKKRVENVVFFVKPDAELCIMNACSLDVWFARLVRLKTFISK